MKPMISSQGLCRHRVAICYCALFDLYYLACSVRGRRASGLGNVIVLNYVNLVLLSIHSVKKKKKWPVSPSFSPSSAFPCHGPNSSHVPPLQIHIVEMKL